MINASERDSQNRERPCIFEHPAVVFGNGAERIVNIAGLGFGDAVMCMGDVGSVVEAAISHTGAHVLAASAAARPDRRIPAQFISAALADAVLWAANGLRRTALAETLPTLRHYLRPGGRLVIWGTPDDCPSVQACSQRLQWQVREAGFSSVIAGQLSSDGGDVVVATGILKP